MVAHSLKEGNLRNQGYRQWYWYWCWCWRWYWRWFSLLHNILWAQVKQLIACLLRLSCWDLLHNIDNGFPWTLKLTQNWDLILTHHSSSLTRALGLFNPTSWIIIEWCIVTSLQLSLSNILSSSLSSPLSHYHSHLKRISFPLLKQAFNTILFTTIPRFYSNQ